MAARLSMLEREQIGLGRAAGVSIRAIAVVGWDLLGGPGR